MPAAQPEGGYHPREGKQPESEERCLTTEVDADALRLSSLVAIRSAGKSGELAKSKRLAYLLFMWRDLATDEGAEVKAWTATQMNDDAMIATFARAFTSYSWSQSLGMTGLGDTVAKRNTRANVDALDKILDKDVLRVRVEQLATGGASDDGSVAIREFLSAWKQRDTDPYD